MDLIEGPKKATALFPNLQSYQNLPSSELFRLADRTFQQLHHENISPPPRRPLKMERHFPSRKLR